MSNTDWISRLPAELKEKSSKRRIKCEFKGFNSSWPETPRQFACTSPTSALNWIKDVSWDHVVYGECNLLRCRTAKVFADFGIVFKLGPKRVGYNYAKYYGTDGKYKDVKEALSKVFNQ